VLRVQLREVPGGGWDGLEDLLGRGKWMNWTFDVPIELGEVRDQADGLAVWLGDEEARGTPLRRAVHLDDDSLLEEVGDQGLGRLTKVVGDGPGGVHAKGDRVGGELNVHRRAGHGPVVEFLAKDGRVLGAEGLLGLVGGTCGAREATRPAGELIMHEA